MPSVDCGYLATDGKSGSIAHMGQLTHCEANGKLTEAIGQKVTAACSRWVGRPAPSRVLKNPPAVSFHHFFSTLLVSCPGNTPP